MLQPFKDYINREKLCRKTDKILLAVSGGLDSMVMCDLFLKADYLNLSIAHCNFNLRGEDSNKDEAFVAESAASNNIRFYSKSFDTKTFAVEKSVSVQMAARELRYGWFDELLGKHEYDVIATAHHADDNIETFFINLLRGAGIRGLKGILPRNGKLIRPLLFATRDMIEIYGNSNSIHFREDSSNHSHKYLRNKIRLQLLPVLEQISPNYRDAMQNSMKNLSGNERLYRKMLEDYRQLLFRKDDKGRILIPIDKVLMQHPMHVLLFELLSPFGFGAGQVEKIIHCFEGVPGRKFYSPTHQLLIDREFIILAPGEGNSEEEYLIYKDDLEIRKPVNLEIAYREIDDQFKIPTGKNIACLDLHKITFPLEVTHWKEGDSFRPFGMKGRKKVSDFFIDKKLSRMQKEETFILRSAGNIVWIIGHRIDDDYRITPLTKEAIILKHII